MRTAFFSSTTIRTGLGIFALGGVCVTLLIGCGGGDPATIPTSTSTALLPQVYVSSSGSVTHTFVVNGSNLRYMVIGPTKDTAGNYTNTALLDQFGSGTAANIAVGTSGEVVRLGSNTLADVSGTNKYAVQQIAGDATFAQGRWTKGLVTNAGGTATLSGTDNQAFHYLAFNALTAFPVGPATRTCTSLQQTGASYVGDTQVGETTTVGVGALGGQVQITFDGLGNATVPINVLVAAHYPTPSFNTIDAKNFSFTLANAATASPPFESSGSFTSPGLGLMVVLGSGDAAGLGDNILLGVAYRVQLNSGYNYQGIISLHCN
jgi:hypothetical protein